MHPISQLYHQGSQLLYESIHICEELASRFSCTPLVEFQEAALRFIPYTWAASEVYYLYYHDIEKLLSMVYSKSHHFMPVHKEMAFQGIDIEQIFPQIIQMAGRITLIASLLLENLPVIVGVIAARSFIQLCYAYDELNDPHKDPIYKAKTVALAFARIALYYGLCESSVSCIVGSLVTKVLCCIESATHPDYEMTYTDVACLIASVISISLFSISSSGAC